METCDVIVLGAGIAGASAAYELAADHRVIVLEAEDAPGYHTTGRSAAQFLETYGNRVIRRLTRASRAFYDSPPDGFADHPLLSPRPALFVAPEDQLDALAHFEAEAVHLSARVERLGPDEMRRMVPVLREGYAAAGVIETDSMDIDVHALHQGYLRGLRRRGGRIVPKAEADGLIREARHWRVDTRVGAFAAPVVINAAGAWCDEVARRAGVRPVGLIPKRRTVITIDGPDGVDCSAWPLAGDVDETFYFKPESGRILASPADETPMPPCDVQPDELDVAITVDRIQTATTLQVRRIEHKWAGLRCFVADKSLVIGFDDRAEGFFWLAGQGGYGIQTAPAAGRLAAALATGGDVPADIAALGLTAADVSPARLDRT
jgi:D-arginine dehydrogenase